LKTATNKVQNGNSGYAPLLRLAEPLPAIEVIMERNILDSKDDLEKHGKEDFGLSVIIVSIIIHVFLYFISGYKNSCGLDIEEVISFSIFVLITLLLYIIQDRFVKVGKWVFIGLGSALMIITGILYFTVIC
jgi:hypothetical protein